MKESIYTIPLNDAFDTPCECAICELENKLDYSLSESALGASMMEPDSRLITNQKGFCKKHFYKLYDEGPHLSLALICATHIDSLLEIVNSVNNENPKYALFSKKVQNQDINALTKATESCAICDKINIEMVRYVENFFYLYDNETEFKQKFLDSNGFCINHFIMLYDSCEKNLAEKKLKLFRDELIDLEKTHLRRLKTDIDFYAKKHDYRYKDYDWGDSKDAPIRAIKKIIGNR